VTQYSSHSVAAAMAGEVVKVGYFMQGEIFIPYNFINMHLQQVSCIYSLLVHGNE